MASERVQRRIERLLDQAEEAMDRSDWEAVRDHAKVALGLDPENADALAFLASVEQVIETESTTTSLETHLTPQVTEQPASFANGRYQVKRFLGEGGKKKVYLATDTLLDRDVAFALIKTEGLDDVSRTRITREAQAMGRLGSHPHIVTVFDLGEEQSQPFMVTELMAGGDVEGVVEDAPEHRLPLDQAISITQETCRGLEFAHSRGIVHRDLKPGNVWLSGDGVAKIGDFGLAVAIDRSRLTTEGMMVGTVSYMPPEQAMGGAVTPKSDLYSLGAMLYEMITGRPPFLGDESVAIIGQHINTPPVAPSWHNPQCPRPLEALIMRLLAKDPQERPESASDVLSALDGLDLSDVDLEEVDDAHALDSLAGGVFVGRQREMGELKACLEDALSGRGRLVTLVGEPGIGKTRTAQELATYAGLRSAQVLWGRCYEEQGMPPYWPWVQAIRSYVRERDPDQLRSEMGAGAADIAEVVSDVKERLPDLPAPPELESPEQARFRLFDSITTFLKAASQKQPLVLVLDDLHWADQPSLLLLQFVARELGGARVLLVGTYRDMELNRQHPLAETLGELTRERLFQRVLLRGLSQQDVARFIEVAAGVDPPQGLAEAVHTQTEGNPLFVTEVVRLLVQEGELTSERSGDRASWTVRIPEGVREVIGRRLNRLSQRCNDTLTIASVIGREFTLEQLKPLVEDTTEDQLLETLEVALSARVIEELPQAVGRYQFTHALIQETLTEELSLTRRVRLHARIAETLEQLYGDNVEAHAAELAHHFAEAEAILGTEKLIKYSLLAGERALAAYAWEEAQTHFQRGLVARGIPLISDQPAPDGEAAALIFGLSRAQAATAERYQSGEVVTTMRRAFDHYAEVGDLAKAVEIAEYQVTLFTGYRTGIADIVARAVALVAPDSYEAGRLLSTYGRILGVEEGDDEGAQQALGSALTIAQREKDQALEIRTLVRAVNVDLFHFRFEQGVSRGLRAIELAQQVRDHRSEIIARFYVSRIYSMRGDHSEADEHVAAMLDLAKMTRDPYWQASSLLAKHQQSTFVGDWSAARVSSDEALALAPADPRLFVFRTWLEYEVGDFNEGGLYLERLVQFMLRLPSAPTTDFAYTAVVIPAIARITGMVDRFEEAERAAEKIFSTPLATPLISRVAEAGRALTAVVRDDAAQSKRSYDALESSRGVMAAPGGIGGTTDRILGLLAHTMGNSAQATGHFEDSLDFCRNAGYRPELAWTCCDYADTLLQRNEPGDREKAMALLDESLAISSELGMRPLMERVLSRRDILKA